jgi:hypothetical protein
MQDYSLGCSLYDFEAIRKSRNIIVAPQASADNIKLYKSSRIDAFFIVYDLFSRISKPTQESISTKLVNLQNLFYSCLNEFGCKFSIFTPEFFCVFILKIATSSK